MAYSQFETTYLLTEEDENYSPSDLCHQVDETLPKLLNIDDNITGTINDVHLDNALKLDETISTREFESSCTTFNQPTSSTDLKNSECPTTEFDDLPEGKIYHLFVSFSNEDRDIVAPIIADLKSQGFRCCDFESDFVGGVSIPKSMEQHLLASVKMLCMLTPNFTESQACMTEWDLADYCYTLWEKRPHCLIPVKLIPCEIPMRLMRLKYIDAEKEDLIPAIKAAYFRKELPQYKLPNISSYDPEFPYPRMTEIAIQKQNGYVVLRIYASKALRGIRGVRWIFEELSGSEKQKLCDANLEEAIAVYDRIRKRLNSSWAMKLYGLYKCGGRCCLLWFLMFMWIFFAFSVEAIYSKNTEFIAMIVTPIVVTIVYTTIVTCAIRKALKVSTSAVWKRELSSFLNGKFFIVIHEEPGQPSDYILRWLEKRSPRMERSIQEIRSDDIIKDVIDNLFCKNGHGCWSEWGQADEQRHRPPVYRNGCCLCQLAGVESLQDNNSSGNDLETV